MFWCRVGPHWALQNTALSSSLHVLVTIVVIWQTQIWPWLDWLRLRLTLHSFTGARAESWWRPKYWAAKWRETSFISFMSENLSLFLTGRHLNLHYYIWLKWIITCNLNLSLLRASAFPKSWLLTSLHTLWQHKRSLQLRCEGTESGRREEWERTGGQLHQLPEMLAGAGAELGPGNGQRHRSQSRERGGDCQLLPAEPGPSPAHRSLGSQPTPPRGGWAQIHRSH